jgi:uncharacterized protein (DUF2141 family)
MRTIGLPIAFACGLVLIGATAADTQGANRIGVSVSGVRSASGVVRCGLYANPNGFPQPGRELRGTSARINGQSATCVFSNVPAGTYAVAAFHAERNEPQIEYGAFGKPKQGYGFSNNPSSAFGAPSFAAASFNYGGGSQSVGVRLQY